MYINKTFEFPGLYCITVLYHSETVLQVYSVMLLSYYPYKDLTQMVLGSQK